MVYFIFILVCHVDGLLHLHLSLSVDGLLHLHLSLSVDGLLHLHLSLSVDGLLHLHLSLSVDGLLHLHLSLSVDGLLCGLFSAIIVWVVVFRRCGIKAELPTRHSHNVGVVSLTVAKL